MNRHQVLTGACNLGDHCYAVGSVEGIHFTAYAAGCNIVILASNFERVQIIPGVTHGNIKVSCIDCSSDTGKIAASYGRKVHIFEPTPLIHESSHKLDYCWYRTATIEVDCVINAITWNMEGSKLLTGGENICIWQFEMMDTTDEDVEPQNRKVQFSLGTEDDDPIVQQLSHVVHGNNKDLLYHGPGSWECVWKCKPATTVYHVKFSPDGFLFATAGKADRLVKIWYEDRKVTPQLIRSDSISPKKEELHYSFVYIAHPRAVTGFSWRKTSKYMPRGSVANMLVTSCLDNVCRVWCETILPDDGLLDLEQFDPSTSLDSKFTTSRHKKRFIQRLKTIRHAIHKRRKQPKYNRETVMSVGNLSSMGSVHDFHKFAIHHNGVSPVLHFHLAGSINPETDIPLQPVIGNKDDVEHNFKIHWLNNKELQFTIEAEKILQEMYKQLSYEDRQTNNASEQNTDVDEVDSSRENTDHDSDHDDINQKKKKRGFFKRRGKNKNKDEKSLGSHTDSASSLSSGHGSDGSNTEISNSVMESLDRKIEVLLRDWHQNADMLFSIHPVDGSFLVWLVDWLDEYTPVCFRQAQVSFSSRLPHAFPIADARSMSSNLLMYCNYSKMDIKSAMKMDYGGSGSKNFDQPASATGKNSPGQNDNMLIPSVMMITKHKNGSINQWQISFTDNSKFQTIISVAHASRACGHRFRTNAASCHPVLPLLLTSSHHNIPEEETPDSEKPDDEGLGFPFCSELILWRVDPVGPLSKSGGITELARINAPPVSAFANVAWVPTLLPSTSLGSYSNSPSALFVASDGSCLRLYQAMIDARSLLMETAPKREQQGMSFSSTGTSSSYKPDNGPKLPSELFNIVSEQSSSRPGCIIELEAITDAKQDWQNVQLLHVFQEQLVTGKMGNMDSGGANMEAIVDLRNLGSFEENFYLVVLEKLLEGGSMLHMWKITISSQLGGGEDGFGEGQNGFSCFAAEDSSSDGASPEDPMDSKPSSVMTMSLSTAKVCSHKLDLPDTVDVVCATVSAGHLSSASIYPACFAPYQLVTACTDGEIRFWKCEVLDIDVNSYGMTHSNYSSLSVTSYEFSMDDEAKTHKPNVKTQLKSQPQDVEFSWVEWEMMNSGHASSAISLAGKPITISCAYSGRFSVAYRYGHITTKTDNLTDKFVNLCVAIYECESTGGSEWILEDTIELRNIKIPDPKAEIDLSMIFSPDGGLGPREESRGGISPSSSFANMTRTKSVPSLCTIQTVRRSIAEHGNRLGVLRQKSLVQLDWVSTEDGSHILTVGVGPKILTYSQVSNEIAQESKKAMMNTPEQKTNDPVKSRPRPMLQKSKSLVVDEYQEEIRWMRLRAVELNTADGLPPLPMHLSWVRAGILVIGMDNEMHVYSQWRPPFSVAEDAVDGQDDFNIDKRTLTESNLAHFSTGSVRNKLQSKSSFKPSRSMPSFKRLSTNFSVKKKEWNKSEQTSTTSKSSLQRSDSLTSLAIIHDFGLFEAARQANPVLPQYHPKQLLELLNFGKIKRVKAILAHLVRCIAGSDGIQAVFADEAENDEMKSYRQRSVSAVSAAGIQDNQIVTEDISDFGEINSIPPLPMYALLAADADNSGINMEIAKSGAVTSPNKQQDYSDLFVTNVLDDEEYDVSILSTSADSSGKRTKLSSSGPTQNPYLFAPNQAQVLAEHLLHVRLPGLSSLDQMYLMALADTVASTKTDFAEQFAQDGKAMETSSMDGPNTISHATESMDDCGLRFLLAMRHHIYLLGTLLPGQRRVLIKQGLRSFNLVWAFHSEAKEELLSFIPSMQKGEPIWEDLKQFGVGWWIDNIQVLKKLIEKVAKAAFQINKDPLDAAIFYLAMKKKNVLWGLYRSVDNKKMSEFFRNDFTQERWRKAALKNAFALLGKQMFMQAAAFFLLAGSLNDAINVCLDRLNDIQLALVICRLYDGEDTLPDSVKKILNTNILGYDEKGENYNPRKAHPNPFLRSMSLWLFKNYNKALQTLLQTKVGRPKLSTETDLDASTITPNVFNFYNYLRTHPLLMRQQLAATAPGRRKAVLTGFTRSNSVAVQDHNITTIDKITPMERRLFFATAHVHFKNGCPLLALEVLSKLPPVVDEKDSERLSSETLSMMKQNELIQTGIIDSIESKKDNSKASDFDWSTPLANEKKETANSFDWSQPLSNGTSNSIDWGQPVSKLAEKSEDFDWSQPTSRVRFEDDVELDFKIGSSDEEEEEDDKEIPTVMVEDPTGAIVQEKTSQKIDIMAQQYKFIACLKVLMEELGTLATGFEVDGGQLRYQLYIWLEKEAEILKALCSYGIEEESNTQHSLADANLDSSRDSDEMLDLPKFNRTASVRSDTSASKASLHEVILSDKLDLEAKMERMARRKQWLKMNQQLLRTLISYCIMQGSGGGGLASVRMELLLLLQELQQEKPQQQLLSPLPFPTTLPLLSASIASSKTVISDPIQHLQCMTQDMLHTIIEVVVPPGLSTDLSNIYLLRNLAVALSSCIYQCLCDSDNFVVSLNENIDIGLEGFTSSNVACQASYLMTGVKRRRGRSHSNVNEEVVNTPPAKWPGVTSLRVLLAREKDEDAPKLNILLCEALLAVYVSLLVNGLSTYDPLLLYRLVAHKFDEQTWCALFGGGVRTIIKANNSSIPLSKTSEDELAKHRMRLNMRVMGSSPVANKTPDLKETYKEKFVPPELSMITYFMTKPFVSSSESIISYDSDDSQMSDDEELTDSEDDEEITRPRTLALNNMQQHCDPNSYSWCLIRYCIVHHVLNNLQTFLPTIGIELAELPNCSPLLHALLKVLEKWDELLHSRLDLFACPPDDYIAGLRLDVVTGVPHTKYQALLDPNNTPFIGGSSSLPMKRLWFQLVKQPDLKEIFIRYIYRNKRVGLDSTDSMRTCTTDSDTPARSTEPMKIIHKEQDIITAFSINQANLNCIALATQKELVELDITKIINPPSWLEDETEYDIEFLKNPSPQPPELAEFLVVQTPQDSPLSQTTSQSGTHTPNTPYIPSAPGAFPIGTFPYAQTGRGTSVIQRRLIPGVRRIGCHPNLPHYLTGSADGSVRFWEWGHTQSLSILRQPGSFPKVTKVLFNAQGNKCCVSDIEGAICLWQVGLGSSFNKPIMSLSCHNKTTSDFTFVGSSSLIATAGHSSESRNVCLWDTLLPKRSSLVHAFNCHEHGSPAVIYAPQHQLLISGGRKGEICIFDLRQRQLRHTFHAHDGPIKCLTIDPEEEYFITGSADGDIKVWALDVHQLIFSFPGEHSKNTFFKNVGSTSGVAQVAIGPGHHLFSCGVDGSMKFRQLPEKELLVHHWT
ncbi:hypothetical protein SNE40_012599 [Patella caerulea]|uniref:RAVE complex protein Rav1 C-terminal domain-containing protein n=1 Tax=Patella caerulea TaxID=87958 RepID=A0AAN8JPU0_PATCE